MQTASTPRCAAFAYAGASAAPSRRCGPAAPPRSRGLSVDAVGSRRRRSPLRPAPRARRWISSTRAMRKSVSCAPAVASFGRDAAARRDATSAPPRAAGPAGGCPVPAAACASVEATRSHVGPRTTRATAEETLVSPGVHGTRRHRFGARRASSSARGQPLLAARGDAAPCLIRPQLALRPRRAARPYPHPHLRRASSPPEPRLAELQRGHHSLAGWRRRLLVASSALSRASTRPAPCVLQRAPPPAAGGGAGIEHHGRRAGARRRRQATARSPSPAHSVLDTHDTLEPRAPRRREESTMARAGALGLGPRLDVIVRSAPRRARKSGRRASAPWYGSAARDDRSQRRLAAIRHVLPAKRDERDDTSAGGRRRRPSAASATCSTAGAASGSRKA